MKRVYWVSTGLFWLMVAAFWGASLWTPSRQAPETQAVDRRFTLADVAEHDRVNDCWMAIDGKVYDLTDYLPKHPTAPSVIVPWCGKEATRAYATKNRRRPHSSYASGQLQSYRIGVLDDGGRSDQAAPLTPQGESS